MLPPNNYSSHLTAIVPHETSNLSPLSGALSLHTVKAGHHSVNLQHSCNDNPLGDPHVRTLGKRPPPQYGGAGTIGNR